MGLTLVKQDMFTEASDTALASHTADQGGGWVTAQSGAAASVIAASGRVKGTNQSSGNRYNMVTALPSDQMDVVGKIWLTGEVSPGVRARRGAMDDDNYGFVYVVLAGYWEMDDEAGNVATFTDSQPANRTGPP